MLDRSKQLKILVASYDRALVDMDTCLEALEAGKGERTAYTTMARALSTMKHDALHLDLRKLADLAAAGQAIVDHALETGVGLPLDLLHAAAKELRAAMDTLAAGGRHKMDDKLLVRLQTASKKKSVEKD